MCSIRQNVALSTFWEVFHIKHLVALTKVQTHASDRNACIMYIYERLKLISYIRIALSLHFLTGTRTIKTALTKD
jgi:hypothetical protein